MDQTARSQRRRRRSLRCPRLALSLGVAFAMIVFSACGGTSTPSSPVASESSGTPALTPAPTPSPSGSSAQQQMPDWFRAMVLRVARRYGDSNPREAWWALTTEEKARLAGGNPGGDPARQVFFAIVRGDFRSGQYQFFSLEADPVTHKRLGFVIGGGFDRTAVGTMTAFDPSISVSERDLSAAEAVVRQLVAAVNGNRFARARALMVHPDRSWSLDDMKSIRWVRLRRVTLLRVDAPDAIWLTTDLRRRPPPIAGNPYWPNFMLAVRTSSGEWKVANTATGP